MAADGPKSVVEVCTRHCLMMFTAGWFVRWMTGTSAMMEQSILVGLKPRCSAVQEYGTVFDLLLDFEREPGSPVLQQRQAVLFVCKQSSHIVCKHVLRNTERYQGEQRILALGLTRSGGYGVHVMVVITSMPGTFGGAAANVEQKLRISRHRVAAQFDVDRTPTKISAYLPVMACGIVQPRGDATAKFIHEENHSVDGQQILDRAGPSWTDIVSCRVPNTCPDSSDGLVADPPLPEMARWVQALHARQILHDVAYGVLSVCLNRDFENFEVTKDVFHPLLDGSKRQRSSIRITTDGVGDPQLFEGQFDRFAVHFVIVKCQSSRFVLAVFGLVWHKLVFAVVVLLASVLSQRQLLALSGARRAAGSVAIEGMRLLERGIEKQSWVKRQSRIEDRRFGGHKRLCGRDWIMG